MLDPEFHRDMNMGDWQVKSEDKDLRTTALDRALTAVGPRTIDNPSNYAQLIVDTAKQFEEYLRGPVAAPARQQSTTTTEQRLMAMGNKWTHEVGCVLHEDHDGKCAQLLPGSS